MNSPSLSSCRAGSGGAAVLLLAVLLSAGGCHSYLGEVIRWNMFEPTPHFQPAAPTLDVARLLAAPPAWVRLGHATTLVSTPAGLLATDPLIFDRMHAFLGFGPRRITRLPAVDVKKLPVRVIVISHNHADHYEPSSILQFNLKDVLLVLPPGIPLKDQQSFARAGARVEVLSWAGWEGKPAEAVSGELRIRAFPVNHWGTKCTPDYQCANGYAIEAPGFRVAYFGDTAELDFDDDRGSGFDLCLLPIGSNTYIENHVTPRQAWAIHTAARCRHTTPIHWDTFIDEPRPRYCASTAEWRRWVDEPLCGLVLQAQATGRLAELSCSGIGVVCTPELSGIDEAFLKRCQELAKGPHLRYRNQFE